MRIAVDISSLVNNTSGIRVHILNILSVLQRIDHENDYFLFTPVPVSFSVSNPKWRVINSRMIKFPFHGTVWFQFFLPLLLLKHRVDCLWAPDYFCPVFVARNIKVVLTLHDCTYFYFPQVLEKNLVFRFKHFLAKSIQRAAAIITVSDCVKNDIIKIHALGPGKKIMSLPNGKPFWTKPSGYSASARADYLFFAGNFEPRKNILNLIKALELLYIEGRRVPLMIAGPSGWSNDYIHSYINKSVIKDSITFLGFLPENLLIGHYCSCKALVYPSLYEGFGMPVLEALCMDCLVLTSQNTVMQEICRDAALYFDPAEPRDIAKIVGTIFQKDFNRNNYLRHADGVLNKYSWDTTAAGLLQVLTQ